MCFLTLTCVTTDQTLLHGALKGLVKNLFWVLLQNHYFIFSKVMVDPTFVYVFRTGECANAIWYTCPNDDLDEMCVSCKKEGHSFSCSCRIGDDEYICYHCENSPVAASPVSRQVTTATVGAISSLSRSPVILTIPSLSAVAAAGTTTNSSISATNTGSSKQVAIKPVTQASYYCYYWYHF
jgi:hypothetical protein